MVSVAILGAGIFAKEGKIILHRSLVIQKPDVLNNKAYVPSLVSLGDQVIVKAVYSRSEKSSRDFTIILKSALGQNAPDPSIYHDGDPHKSLDALLARPDIEAVFVILPISKHPEVVLKALAAGKHVLSEKPTAKDVATGIELVRKYVSKYRPKGLVWRVAENFEYEPLYQEAGQLIRNGQIGRVISFSASGSNSTSKDDKYYKTDWRTVPDISCSLLASTPNC